MDTKTVDIRAAVPHQKKKIWLRVLCIALAAILLIVTVGIVTVACLWSNEISSVMSFKMLRERNDANKEGAVYRMNIKGGFYFDDFLASGGAKNDTELINFITTHITKGLIDLTIKETDIGCSSFTATAENGDVLFARNYDFAKTNVCLVFCDPGKGRHKSFSTVDLNYIGMSTEGNVEGLMNKVTCLAAPYAPLDGINDAGGSCAIYMSTQGEPTVATNQNDPTKADITSTTMLRLILDYADDVDEAVALVKQYNLHDSANTSFHYMVADATGKSAILEWVPENGTDSTDHDGSARKLVVTYNTGDEAIGTREAGADYQWITNFIIQPGYYASDDEKPGYDRYEHIYERLSQTDGTVKDEEAAMEILQEIGRRTWKSGNGVTVHSAVYNLTKKTVLWVANENYGDKTATYEYSLVTGELRMVE